MNIKVVIDYSIERRHHVWIGAMLAATKMHNDYVTDRRRGLSVGPEGFAEEWFKKYMTDLEVAFERLVMNCFLQILGQAHG